MRVDQQGKSGWKYSLIPPMATVNVSGDTGYVTRNFTVLCAVFNKTQDSGQRQNFVNMVMNF
jgi:hypothetical protein